MKLRFKSTSGFTIVELLIVIVIIGILAEITIVAYNGIQDRARVSSVSSGLSQGAKKLKLFQVDNPDTYPVAAGTNGLDNLATLGITNTSDVSYQYSSSANTYCLTATNGTTSYKISSSSTTASSGGCAGHGVGGVAAITNLVTNPSFEVNATGWGNYGNSNNYTISSAQAYNGTASMLLTEPSDGGSHGFQIGFAASAGNSYTASASVYRVSGASNIILRVEWYTATSTYIGANQLGISAASSPVGSWVRQSVTATAPANTGKAVLVIAYQGAVNSESFYGDAMMVTNSTTAYNYADGSSTNWIWNGTANNATSTGPAL